MEDKIRNPFIIGGYVAPAYFCDRKKESEELLTSILNFRNTSIISPRRMGKTGLIRHCFYSPLIKKDFHAFVRPDICKCLRILM